MSETILLPEDQKPLPEEKMVNKDEGDIVAPEQKAEHDSTEDYDTDEAEEELKKNKFGDVILISDEIADERTKRYTPEQIEGAKKRYLFYQSNPNGENPSHQPQYKEEEIEKLRQRIATTNILSEIHGADGKDTVKSQEMVEKIHEIERRIIEFAHTELGLELTEANFPMLDNIHIRDVENYPVRQLYTAGFFGQNEVMVREGLNPIKEYNLIEKGLDSTRRKELAMIDFEAHIEHELIHSACKQKAYLGDNLNNKLGFVIMDKIKTFGFGSIEGENSAFHYLSEALTEITNQQLLRRHGQPTLLTGYQTEIILLTEMIKDMAKKINENPKLVKTKIFSTKEAKEVTPENILKHLQIGMFKNDRRYFSLVKDIYGKDIFKKLKDSYNPPKVLELKQINEKLDKFYKGEEFSITLSDGDGKNKEDNILCTLNDKKFKEYEN